MQRGRGGRASERDDDVRSSSHSSRSCSKALLRHSRESADRRERAVSLCQRMSMCVPTTMLPFPECLSHVTPIRSSDRRQLVVWCVVL